MLELNAFSESLLVSMDLLSKIESPNASRSASWILLDEVSRSLASVSAKNTLASYPLWIYRATVVFPEPIPPVTAIVMG